MISTAQALTQATLTGAGQTIPIVWPFLAATDLTVVQTRASVDTVLVLNTDYTVTGGGTLPAAGNVIMVAGLNGDVITVYRAVPLTQTTQFTSLSTLPAKTLETTYDRLEMQVQQQQNQISRALRLPLVAAATADLSLAARKSNVLGFDSNGNITFYSFISGAIAPQSIAGTTNQVLVNGATTPVTGAVTLTLPQAIGTASVVQFGGMGLGIAPQTDNILSLAHPSPTLVASAAVQMYGTIDKSADSTTAWFPNAFRDITIYKAGKAADAYCSYDVNTQYQGSVAANHYYAYQARHFYNASNTLDVMAGYVMAATVNLGTVTEMRGLYIPTQTVSGGTVTHFAGIYMDSLGTFATTTDAIYCAGPNRWFCAGGQIMTSATLAAPAGALTARGVFTFDQATQTGMAVMNSNATATGRFIDFCNSAGTSQGNVNQTNNTTIAFNTSSDARLKTRVRDFEGSGELVDRIHPVIFDWMWGGKDAHGFIAQDLYAIYPAAVTPGLSDEVNAAGELLHPWGMDNSKLVPLLFAEVKSLRARVAQLEAA